MDDTLAMCILSPLLCIRVTLVEGSNLQLLRRTEQMGLGPNRLPTPHPSSSFRSRTCAPALNPPNASRTRLFWNATSRSDWTSPSSSLGVGTETPARPRSAIVVIGERLYADPSSPAPSTTLPGFLEPRPQLRKVRGDARSA
ncbi:hypothetical protein L226DRAFT_218854 [Lentinus tigrinus ALCF2SS1-7]|uniref:uncharacterized protein n=1 Tax=Lentinus tigrinus ALCF2SS1-7 TaxID=1328758 RepID=UPI001166381D|nr:hypothetical protein L226DRAFT_218854 [Lentinus tigrinus ALCF2SS1-7]